LQLIPQSTAIGIRNGANLNQSMLGGGIPSQAHFDHLRLKTFTVRRGRTGVALVAVNPDNWLFADLSTAI
jgi:hypothetical protein